MANISFRVPKEDEELIREYVAINDLNLSAFVREAVLEKIEEDLELDEARILSALDVARKEEKYDHVDVWAKLGVE
jgi:uncharacterized protein (DUF1778 family)